MFRAFILLSKFVLDQAVKVGLSKRRVEKNGGEKEFSIAAHRADSNDALSNV
jgi:hypothetical protein